jgi:hypothetical protein
MNLTGIIAISGKPGLFKVITQAKNSVIVESLIDKKRIPAYATDRISALEDISIYTYSEDKPLKEILKAIYNKENGKACISHKESEAKLTAYLLEILPDYDAERVYVSDIKKLFQWYNLLESSGNLVLAEDDSEEAVDNKEDSTEEKPKASKVSADTKKTAVKKSPVAAAPKASPKSAGKTSGGAKVKTTVQRKSGSN